MIPKPDHKTPTCNPLEVPLEVPLKRQKQSHWRQRWLRITLRKLPRRANLHNYPLLKHVAHWVREHGELWSFKSTPVRKALYIGLVLAFLPIMGIQAPIAIAVAFFTRANMTVMVGTQFVTNPFTVAPLYYLTYQLGDFLLTYWPGYSPEPLQQLQGMEGHLHALLLGGVIVGLLTAVLLDFSWQAMRKWIPIRK